MVTDSFFKSLLMRNSFTPIPTLLFMFLKGQGIFFEKNLFLNFGQWRCVFNQRLVVLRSNDFFQRFVAVDGGRDDQRRRFGLFNGIDVVLNNSLKKTKNASKNASNDAFCWYTPHSNSARTSITLLTKHCVEDTTMSSEQSSMGSAPDLHSASNRSNAWFFTEKNEKKWKKWTKNWKNLKKWTKNGLK